MLPLYMSFIDDESHRRLFEEIYMTYRKQMHLVARGVLSQDADAEDVVHNVFLKIAQKHMGKVSRIESDTDLRNYLLKATKHAALDHLRKHRRERISLDAEGIVDLPETPDLRDDAFVEKICNSMEYDRILSAIAALKDIYREVMYYHFVMELSVPEVAKLMECKVSTVKQRLVRGKKLLYGELFGGMGNESGEQL